MRDESDWMREKRRGGEQETGQDTGENQISIFDGIKYDDFIKLKLITVYNRFACAMRIEIWIRETTTAAAISCSGKSFISLFASVFDNIRSAYGSRLLLHEQHEQHANERKTVNCVSEKTQRSHHHCDHHQDRRQVNGADDSNAAYICICII